MVKGYGQITKLWTKLKILMSGYDILYEFELVWGFVTFSNPTVQLGGVKYDLGV